MADDDADDRRLTEEAFKESRLANILRFVEDGKELLQYLRHEGEFQDKEKYPRPGLILLDLNMPKMDGSAALREIKSDPLLCDIPVNMLTTSETDRDICRSYDLGVNSYILKPVTFAALVDTLQTLNNYWFRIVE